MNKFATVEVNDLVAYLPSHAKGDLMHPDMELGKVTRVDDTHVFVRFGEEQHSKACNPNNLVKFQ